MNNQPVFIYDNWVCALREWEETIERERVLVIVKNRKTELYLIVQYTSNGDVGFPSGWIEIWHTKEETVKKELEEETWITQLNTIQELTDMYFTVKSRSPNRQKNYHSNTHVFFAETVQEWGDIHEDEKVIQHPHWRTLEQIKAKIEEGKDNTNYEAMEYLVECIEKKGL